MINGPGKYNVKAAGFAVTKYEPRRGQPSMKGAIHP
jgi:hypothetical protein